MIQGWHLSSIISQSRLPSLSSKLIKIHVQPARGRRVKPMLAGADVARNLMATQRSLPFPSSVFFSRTITPHSIIHWSQERNRLSPFFELLLSPPWSSSEHLNVVPCVLSTKLLSTNRTTPKGPKAEKEKIENRVRVRRKMQVRSSEESKTG